MATPTKAKAIQACKDIEAKPGPYGPNVVRVLRNTRKELEKIDLLCPKCGSEECIRDGTTIRKGGEIQAARCKKCGYRGPAKNF